MNSSEEKKMFQNLSNGRHGIKKNGFGRFKLSSCWKKIAWKM